VTLHLLLPDVGVWGETSRWRVRRPSRYRRLRAGPTLRAGRGRDCRSTRAAGPDGVLVGHRLRRTARPPSREGAPRLRARHRPTDPRAPAATAPPGGRRRGGRVDAGHRPAPRASRAPPRTDGGVEGAGRRVMALVLGIEVPGVPFPSGPFHRLRPRVDQPTVDEHLVSQSPRHIQLVAIGEVTEVVLHVRLEPFPRVAVADVAEVVHALPPGMMSDLARPPHPHGIPADDASDDHRRTGRGRGRRVIHRGCLRPTDARGRQPVPVVSRPSRWPVGRSGRRAASEGEFAVAGVTPFVREIS